MHSSRNTLAVESAIVANLVNNSEATMRVVVSSSAATILFALKARYWGDNIREEDKSRALKQCIDALKALPEYNNIARRADINFIIAKTEEPISDLDEVSLYFPEHGQVNVLFPLKEVLPLVWQATHDNAQFMHHCMEVKDEAAQLAAAQQDRSDRILTFLNCLKELRRGICHHGIRNALVLTLNGTYKGIDILEDERSTITAFLKDRINDGFWKCHQEAKEEDEKNRLMSALLTWINTNNPREVLALIDPGQQLINELHQLFIHHHVDPQYIKLNDLIAQALDLLEFETSTDQEHEVLRVMHKIMNSGEINQDSLRGQALIEAQEWIKSHGFAWKNAQFCVDLNTFYSFYLAHNALNKDHILLTLAGREAETRQLLNDIQAYFQQWQTQKKPPAVDLRLKQHLSELYNTLAHLKKEAMQTEIASFFALWRNALDDQEVLKKCYQLLLNENFQTKVLLSKEAAQVFNHALQEAEASGGHKELDAYEINRFLLSAHLKKPQEWTSDFAAAFQSVLTFVQHLPAEENGENINPGVLKKGSYPDILLEQLSYRYLLYRNSQPGAAVSQQERPPSWLLPLPDEMKTAAEWIRIAHLLEKNQRAAVYQRHAVWLIPALKQALEETPDTNFYTLLFQTIPNEHLVIHFFKPLIKEFFGLWYKALDDGMIPQDEPECNAARKYYSLLLNENFQKKVLLSNEAVRAFHHSLQEAEISGIHQAIDVYEINRFLLSAHLKHSQEWTSDFAAAFQAVLTLVKRWPTGEKLCFFEGFLEQLSYYRYVPYLRQTGVEVSHQEKPFFYLPPPPETMETIEEWLSIWAVLEENQRAAVYQRHAACINLLLHQDLEKNPTVRYCAGLFQTIPNEQMENFLKIVGSDMIPYWEYRCILFAQERTSFYLGALSDYFKSVISRPETLWELTRDFSSLAAIDRFLDAVGVDHIKTLINSEQDWIFVFERLTPKYQQYLIKNTDKTVLESSTVAQKIRSLGSSASPTLFQALGSARQATLTEHLNTHHFLQHIVLGEQKEAEEMLKQNGPSLLLKEAIVVDYSGRRIEGTALTLAFGADDADMIEMLKPYFEALEPNQAARENLMQAQVQKRFPPGWGTREEVRANNDRAALKEVVRAISGFETLGTFEEKLVAFSKAYDADHDREINEVLETIPGPALDSDHEAFEEALKKFRAYLDPKPGEVIQQGKHFNIQLLIDALVLYGKTYHILGGAFAEPSHRNDLFWHNIIGYIQRQLPACYVQAFRQGINSSLQLRPLQRLSFRFDDQLTQYFPLTASSRLGFEYAYDLQSYWLGWNGKWNKEYMENYVQKKQQSCESIHPRWLDINTVTNKIL